MCLQQRWRPWNATWSGDPATDPAFLSNNASMGYDRSAVLNQPEGGEWAAAVAADYGKFVNSSYVWQIWEPSDQADILQALQVSG